jgi:hypothetical protein
MAILPEDSLDPLTLPLQSRHQRPEYKWITGVGNESLATVPRPVA